ncbi:DUF6323 family protein [Pseudobacteroides cellulosolvens]|uniref:Uncharacterized protein n=1 Tax=Pseudobacteroides cellulosolvens ATCC 35603 = DSM 2933 TaxID=398512 RepID=A0A0L6JUM8_9FIRM|nr:DUF6323 family protein [Pseudobacteroides cellulosolvens]KNY29350.1 hypothetical protein Bccel_4624 [Pseudobacteroides cellulosolvens ATCC 35603 = DSM 2933]
MDKKFLISPILDLSQSAVDEIIKCNETTSRYGLVLSPDEAKELVETRNETLKGYGRIELGGGIINKLIEAFCDSPYIIQKDYSSILHELIETFYYYKNETLDQLSDDELIDLMKDNFNNRCHGSLELLQNRDLDKIARNIRYGEDDFDDLDEADGADEYFFGEDYE